MCDFYIYELDKILKSDMDELVKIFGIVSAIATAIAAFLTFRTLKEVKTQRESMYMPDIIIEEKQFFIYGAETSKGISCGRKIFSSDFFVLHFKSSLLYLVYLTRFNFLF